MKKPIGAARPKYRQPVAYLRADLPAIVKDIRLHKRVESVLIVVWAVLYIRKPAF